LWRAFSLTSTYRRARKKSGELSRSLHSHAQARLTPCIRRTAFGEGDREARRAAIHTLLTAELLELRYNDLDCAISELEKQVVKDI
jgi:hypothetical protein